MRTRALSVFLGLAVLASFAISGCDKSNSTPEASKSKLTELLNITPDFLSVSGLEAGTEYEPGTKIILNLKAGDATQGVFQDYHMQHLHVHVNDTVYMPVYPENAEGSVDEVPVEITVPDKDFEIVACYSVQQQLIEDGYTIYLEKNDEVKLYGASLNAHYKYFDCYLVTPENYTITDVQFKMGSDEWKDVKSVNGCSFERTKIENVYNISIRPDYKNVTGDVTLRVTGEQHGKYHITWINGTDKYLNMEKSVLPSESIDGETVTAELWVNGEYYLKDASSSVSDLDLSIISRSYIQFKMPAEDVTITLDILEKVPVEYVTSPNISKAEFYDADDIYYGVPTSIGTPGENVYLFASANDGYKPESAVNSATGEKFAFSYYGMNIYMAAVKIPEDASSLKAGIETAKVYTVTGNSNIQFNGGNLYAEGETVKMSIYVPEGKKITEVKVKTSEGSEVPVTLDLPYASFVMPASDVTVEVTYSDLSVGNTVSVIAYFDEDLYDVSSSTNYDWDFSKGFTINTGSTFYLSVSNYDGDTFYVGVKIGESITTYKAEVDEEMGEASFGKALVANGDVVIKVASSESEVSF